MAWVLPGSSRSSLTIRCTGCATVTFGGGGGCCLGFSRQPDRKRTSTRSTSQTGKTRSDFFGQAIRSCAPESLVRLPIRKPWTRFGLTGGGQVVVSGSQQMAPIRALFHFGLDGGRYQLLALSDLPAAAQGAVYANEACGNRAQGTGQAVLLIQQRLLSGQDRREVRHAFPVLANGEGDGGLGRRHALGQDLRPILIAQEGGQIVLHILLGRQDGVLVGEQERLELGVLHADVVRDLAIVEDVPLDSGTDLDRTASPPEHIAEAEAAQVRREEDETAGEGEGREKICLGHADLGRLSDRLQLRTPDIRSPAQQVGRDAHDDLRW